MYKIVVNWLNFIINIIFFTYTFINISITIKKRKHNPKFTNSSQLHYLIELKTRAMQYFLFSICFSFFFKIFFYRGRSVSTEHDSETEHSEKSPLVSAKLDSLAKLLFSRSLLQDNGFGSKDGESPTRFLILFYQFNNFIIE